MKKVFVIVLAIVVLLASGCSDSVKNHVPLEVIVKNPYSDSEPSYNSGSEFIDGNFSDSEPSGSNSDSEPLYSNSKNPENSVPEEREEPEYIEFFKEFEVHTLELEMETKDWNFLLYNPYAKQYRNANVIIDGVRYDNTAIKTRGNSSLSAYAVLEDNYRPPFKLKFDKYVDDRTFMGLDELVLLNVSDDRSYLREYIGYEAFRVLDFEAPYVTLFNIYANGKLHGLYVGVEAVDKSFLDRVFDSHKHNLYKANNYATLLPNMNYSTFEQKKGVDSSMNDLKYLVKVLNEMPLGEKGDIESILDVDSVLKNFAVDAVLHNWDDYAGVYCHNYYLYMSGGVFYFIPWDMNECCLIWQALFEESPGAKQDIVSPITGDVAKSQRPLVEKLLAVEEYYSRYLQYCSQLNDWLGEIDESGWLDEVWEIIDEHVKNDPTGFYGYWRVSQEYNKSYYGGLARFIHDRHVYLTKRLYELMPGSEEAAETG